jgi:hypothetical protein
MVSKDFAMLRAIHLIDTAAELLRCRGSFVTGDLDWSDIFIVAAHRLADFWSREGQSSEVDDRDAHRIALLDTLSVLHAMQLGLEEAMKALSIPATFNGGTWDDIARAVGEFSASAAAERLRSK